MEHPGSSDRIAGPALLAWGVHLLTASGAVLALLALDAVERRSWSEALLWLMVALFIDGIDGALARKLRVREHLPRIDGEALDLVVDYLNYVLVPALLIWRANLLPLSLAFPLVALILLSSLYVFVRRDMKTEDGYFRGFPALWNVAALYLMVIGPAEWASAAIVLLLVALTFAPILVIHPFRAREFGITAPVLAVSWGLSTTALLLPGLPDPRQDLALFGSLVSLAGLLLLGATRTFRGQAPKDAAAD